MYFRFASEVRGVLMKILQGDIGIRRRESFRVPAVFLRLGSFRLTSPVRFNEVLEWQQSVKHKTLCAHANTSAKNRQLSFSELSTSKEDRVVISRRDSCNLPAKSSLAWLPYWFSFTPKAKAIACWSERRHEEEKEPFFCSKKCLVLARRQSSFGPNTPAMGNTASSRFLLTSLDSSLIEDKEWLSLLSEIDRELFDDLFVPILDSALKHSSKERDKWYHSNLGLVVTDTPEAPRPKTPSTKVRTEREAAELMISLVVSLWG